MWWPPYPDAHSLLDEVRRHRPTVVIIDIRMPPTYTTEGLVAAERMATEFPEIGVLVLSLHVEPEYALALINSGRGGVGYLLKERVVDIDQIVTALKEIEGGGAVIDSAIVEELMSRRRNAGRVDRLSIREREVLSLIAQGYTNQGIADRMHLSAKTVEAHVTSILDRLEIWAADGVHRRVRAVLIYLYAQGRGGPDAHEIAGNP